MAQATALIDGNNFYASCEQSLDPALIGRPVVVLSNNDGCIVARSAEARALGIAMGTPYFKARRELEQQNVVVRSSNYALYADMSQRMMSLLEAHCEELEIYSIDEAFGRISRPAGGELQSWARQLRATVKRDLGLPIAIGLETAKARPNWPTDWPNEFRPTRGSSTWGCATIRTAGWKRLPLKMSGESAANWPIGAACAASTTRDCCATCPAENCGRNVE